MAAHDWELRSRRTRFGRKRWYLFDVTDDKKGTEYRRKYWAVRHLDTLLRFEDTVRGLSNGKSR